MRHLAAALALAVLAACSAEQAPDKGSPAQVANDANGASVGLDIAGRWGASQELCETQWWDFAAEQVRTADGLTCLFQKETPVANGLHLELACVGEGQSNVERWEMTQLPDRKMSLVRDNSAPITLERCALYDR